MSKIKLFSNFFEKRKSEDIFFDNNALQAAYLVGAFASAIIETSWDGVTRDGEILSYVKENETFKKWLSNQSIRLNNLIKIFNKAAYYQRKFNLENAITKDLSTLVTDHLEINPDAKATDQEVSFAFLRGYNDFRTFKYTKKEKNNGNS